ncbi:MAG: AAA family ATPase, partial [Bacillota bacterium]|nr:AAA family ATPase [Bacillota bacterium]
MKNQIYLGQDFLKKLNDFSKKDSKRIIESIGKLTNSDYLSSLKLHSLDRTDCDSTFRSIRVSDDIRIILSQNKNRYIFLYVDHHDKAYLWAEGKYIKENDFNSLAVYDSQSIKKTIDYYDEAYESGYEKPLFENSGLKVKYLENFGLSKEHSELILDIKSEDFLIKFISYLPEEIQEALIDLAIGNKRVDEVINELDKYKDFDLMDNPNSKRRFIEFEKLKSFNLDELIENFDLWKIFLHPNQENLIKGNYLGPTLIEGGPGTGKTVIGMHRTIHLCEKYYPNSNNIYFIVFNRQLVKIVNKKLDELQKVKKTNHNINVINIDKLYYNLLKKHGLNLGYYDKNKIYKIIDNIYEEKDWELSKSFLIKEFFEIIQYKNITTIDEYLEIFRKGQVNQLYKKTREKIWPFFEKLNKQLDEKNIIDFEKRAFILEKLIDEGKLEPFIDSVVIDESQDLSENKLRVLKKLVKTNRNNMFILSDKNQRIYSLYSWKRN